MKKAEIETERLRLIEEEETRWKIEEKLRREAESKRNEISAKEKRDIEEAKIRSLREDHEREERKYAKMVSEMEEQERLQKLAKEKKQFKKEIKAEEKFTKKSSNMKKQQHQQEVRKIFKRRPDSGWVTIEQNSQRIRKGKPEVSYKAVDAGNNQHDFKAIVRYGGVESTAVSGSKHAAKLIAANRLVESMIELGRMGFWELEANDIGEY
jgi:hypothetical protein